MSFCSSCGESVITGTKICPKCNGTTFSSKLSHIAISKEDLAKRPKDTPENRAKKLMEYLVIGQENEWFTGDRFDRLSLEKMLNHYALDGWTVKEMTTSPTFGVIFGTPRDEMIIILERDMRLIP
jgi:hypothetical protein